MARDLELARLFVTIESETKGLEEDLGRTERALDRIGKFVREHTAVAVASLITAFITMGVEAARHTEEIEDAFRLVGATLPDAINKVDDLRAAAEQMSVEFGRSQLELAKAFQAAAEVGQKGTDDMLSLVHAAGLAAQATGGDLQATIRGTDQVLDLFGISAEHSEQVLAKLFVTAQGKASIQELLDTFRRLEPVIRQSGISFETAAADVAVLIDRGGNVRNVVRELTRTLNEEGTQGLEQLALKSKVASDGLKELHDQSERVAESASHQAKVAREELEAAYVRLGQIVLPTWSKIVRNVADLLGEMTGATSAAAIGLDNLTRHFDPTHPQAYSDSILSLVQGLREGKPVLDGLSTEQLEKLNRALEAFVANAGKARPEVARQALEAIGSIQLKLALLANTTLTGLIPATGGAAEALKVLTPELRRAVEASTSLTDAQKKVILETKGLSDEQFKLAQSALKQSIERSKELAQEQQRLRDQMRSTFAHETVNLIDDAAAAIVKFKEEAAKAKLPQGEVKTFTDNLKKQAEQLEALRLSAQLVAEEYGDIVAQKVGLLEEADAIESARQRLTLLTPGTHAYANQLAEIVRLTQLRKDTTADIADEERQIAEANDRLTRQAIDDIRNTKVQRDEKVKMLAVYLSISEKQAAIILGEQTLKQKIIDNVSAVGQVAEAMERFATAVGVADANAKQVLSSIGQIGSNIKDALGGDPSAIFGVIGGLVGVLNGLFSDSPETKARKELLQKNTDALRENATRLGSLLESQTPGAIFSKAGTALNSLLTTGGLQQVGTFHQGVLTGVDNAKLAGFLAESGLRISDLDQLAKDFGIEIRDSSGKLLLGALKQLADAIDEARGKFTTFGDTFEDQMQKIQVGLDTGIIKPADEFGAVLAGLGNIRGGAPSSIVDALRGLNGSDPASRAQAVTGLQDLIRNIDKLTPDQLGGLTGSQFLQVVARLIALLKGGQIGAFELPLTGGAGGEVGGPVVTFAESLDTGFGDLKDAAATTNDLLAEIARNTAAFTPVGAPALPDGSGGSVSAFGVKIATLNINMPVGTTLDDPAGAAAAFLAIAGPLLNQYLFTQFNNDLAVKGRR